MQTFAAAENIMGRLSYVIWDGNQRLAGPARLLSLQSGEGAEGLHLQGGFTALG